MPSKQHSSPFSVVHPHAAGIDIGSTFHVVAAPPECDNMPVRRFQSFTADLRRLSQWLREVGVTSVAMESTGVYCVEGHGIYPLGAIHKAIGAKVIPQ